MGKIISVSNQKGGVGKSTTSVNLASSLASMKYNVLVIDMDPQGNASSGLGIEIVDDNPSIYEMIVGERPTEACIQKTDIERVSIVPSNTDLAAAEMELFGYEDKEYILRKRLKDIENDYDYIFIDCPPSLGILTLNALCASEGVIIPVQCEYYALEGVTQILQTVELVQERLNPKLRIEGIVFTMYDMRTNLSRDVVSNVKENLDVKIYDTIIPRNVRLAEAPSYGLPVLEYDAKSAGAIAYMNLAKEVIRRADI